MQQEFTSFFDNKTKMITAGVNRLLKNQLNKTRQVIYICTQSTVCTQSTYAMNITKHNNELHMLLAVSDSEV